MSKKNYKHFLLFCGFLLTATSSFGASSESDPNNWLTQGKFSGQIRYRYEHVDQDGIQNNADASTVRTNLGFETGTYQGFRGMIEGQSILHLGSESFNDSVNGKTTYPVVADPDDTELNQLWLAWNRLPATEIKAGRQIINLDNQRFIGSVDWRQNDQTFDSFLAEYKGFKDTALHYGYVWNVNRVFGDDHPLGDLDTQSHILHASHQWTDWLATSAYGYWLDIDDLPASSSQTFGLRATGEYKPVPEYSFIYEAEFARQNDFADNPVSYSENYIHIAPGVKFCNITLKAGFEQLGGNGTSSFQTPLATLHKFNGWADKFLTTPAAGLEDKYLSASYVLPPNAGIFQGTEFTAVYHNYDGDKSGDFGSEANFSISKSFPLSEKLFFKAVNVTLKYADYDAEDTPYTDTKKAWLQVGLNF